MEQKQGPRVSSGHFGLQRWEDQIRRESSQYVRHDEDQSQMPWAVECGENTDFAPDLTTGWCPTWQEPALSMES